MITVINGFLSYLLLFVVLIAIALCGAFIGIRMAKNKNAKETMTSEEENLEEVRS